VRYTLHAKAADELVEAIGHYKDRGGKPLARAYLDEFDRVAALILEHPGIGTRVADDLRVLHFKKFPYGVVYRALATEIRILAIAHQHRRPNDWSGRA
jgi:toxin ParE1/3/4